MHATDRQPPFELLTIAEAAQLLRVTPITIRRHIAAGQLAAVKVGKGVRLRREAIEKFVTPIEPASPQVRQGRRVLAGRALSYDDPLWKLIGSATGARPTDASKKLEYLAEGLAQRDS